MDRVFTRGRISALLMIVAIAVAMWVAMSVLDTEKADAHNLSYDSVTSQEWLPMRDQSKYSLTGAHKWDYLNCKWGSSCGGVDVDEVSSNQTVNVVDVRTTQKFGGQYSTSTSPDQIRHNTYYMDGMSPYQKWSVTGHETGHALGFAHPPCSDYYQRYSIMPSGCKDPSDFPASHDRSDYYNKWVD